MAAVDDEQSFLAGGKRNLKRTRYQGVGRDLLGEDLLESLYLDQLTGEPRVPTLRRIGFVEKCPQLGFGSSAETPTLITGAGISLRITASTNELSINSIVGTLNSENSR